MNLKPTMKALDVHGLKAALFSLALAGACLSAQAASTFVRSISNNNTTAPGISITATPDSSVGVYAVEEDLPSGLTPANIDNGGSWDTNNNAVKWGPFFDNTARTLSYTVSGSAATYTLSGVGSPDGGTVTTTGDSSLTIAPVNYTVAVSASPSAGGTVSGGGSFASGSSVTVTANPNSGYQFANWTDGATVVSSSEGGTVVSSSASYSFTLSGNRTLVANFEETSAPISGNLHTTSGTALAGIVMIGLPGNPTTDTNGNYSAQVPSGWCGTVTPTSSGYNFDPPSRCFTNVTTNQAGQDFVAMRETVGIWGSVRTSSGTPLVGIVMNGLPGNPVTDTNGNYNAQVPSGWSGTVTPTAVGYTFNPAGLEFSGVTTTWIGQDFVGSASMALTLVGRGPDGQFQLSISGPPGQALRLQTSGDLVHWQDWTNVTTSGGQDTYSDTPPPGTTWRFYRAVAQ